MLITFSEHKLCSDCLSPIVPKANYCKGNFGSRGGIMVTLSVNMNNKAQSWLVTLLALRCSEPTPYAKEVEPSPPSMIPRTLNFKDLKFCRLKLSESMKLATYLLLSSHSNRSLFKCFSESFGII